MNTSANTRQVGGKHYTAEFQHWDLVAHAGLGYFDGQITKYVGRSRKKNGLQDVEKALHFCDKYIEMMRACVVPEPKNRDADRQRYWLLKYLACNELTSREALVTEVLVNAHGVPEVQQARGLILDIIHEINALREHSNPEDGSAPTPAYVSQGGKSEARF